MFKRGTKLLCQRLSVKRTMGTCKDHGCILFVCYNSKYIIACFFFFNL